MNVLDLILVALLALAGISGYRRGFTMQAFGFGGLLIGLFIGALIAPTVARLTDGPQAQAGLAALVLLSVAGIGNAIGWLLGVRVRDRAAGKFGQADAVAGSATAVVASLLAIWFVALNLVSGPFPAMASQIRGSAVVRTLDAALPEPPSLLAQVRQLFNRFGFPDVFSGIPPLPAEPVDPPTQAQAVAAVDAAATSTVRVVGQACDQILEGSGFVADPRLRGDGRPRDRGRARPEHPVAQRGHRGGADGALRPRPRSRGPPRGGGTRTRRSR